MKGLLLLLCLVGLEVCGQQALSPVLPADRSHTFQMASIPVTIVGQEARARYLVKHYWDHFDFGDTAFVSLPEVTEQAFAGYVHLFGQVPAADRASSIRQMLKRAEANETMYGYFCNLYEKYLYDPHSPLRNDEYYIDFLEVILASSQLDDAYKIRPRYQLEMVRKNRVGEPAADIDYVLSTGKKGSLYHVQADYILLFFYNPGCGMCREVRESIAASSFFTQMQKDKRLKVIAIYPDEDRTAWNNYQPHIPSEWINAYDQGQTVRTTESYDLKAIPTLYLLDKDKKVLLKDVDWEAIRHYFSQSTR